MMPQQHSWSKLPWLKLLVSLGALVLLVVRFIWFGHQIDGITLGLFVIAVLPWYSELIQSLEFGGLKIQFRDIQARQEQQQSEVERLRFVVSHLLTEGEIEILNKLMTRNPYVVGPDPNLVNSPLIGDLRHVFGLGFIERAPDQHFHVFQDKGMREKVDVTAYFTITDIGKKYLKLRDQVDSETSVQKDGS